MKDGNKHKQRTRSKANGEGSIYKIGENKYKGALVIDWKDDGKPIRKTVSGKTHAEVDKKLSDLKVKYGQGLVASPEMVTLNEWGSLWLNTYKAKGISGKTKELYDCIWREHINPALGTKMLNKLNQDQCQRFLNSITDSKENDGKGLSTRTAEICKQLLNQLCEAAIERGLIIKNPCKGVILPVQRTKEKKIISHDNLKKIIHEAKTFNDGALFVDIALFAYTGMRIGEVLALNWSQIDFENRTIYVSAKMVETIGKLTRETAADGAATKNGKSRAVPIGKNLYSILSYKYKSLYNGLEGSKKDKQKIIKDMPVISNKNGGHRSPNNWRRSFRILLKKVGISENITPHQFRHTLATSLIEEGEDLITVQELLGHSSPEVTAKVYVHEIAKRKRKAIDSIDKLI